MTTSKTTVVIGIRVKPSEKRAIERAASDRNIAPAALVFALLHKVSSGFTDFACVPDVMPRSHMVRVSNESEVTE